MSILISIEKLLSGNFVEGTRMEFKEGWNPKTIMRSVCAFANDFENEGSGYIIVGVAEENGKPVRPVKGFDENQFEKVQKDLIGYCNLMSPPYVPRISLEDIDNKKVLVIWVPAGTQRPYKVPDDILAKNKVHNFRIRQFSSSVVPNAEQEMELIQLTAKIPFDDRVNSNFSINDLDFGLMREHLAKTESKLFQESTTMTVEQLAEKMNLCQGKDEHLFPKNVGLLMFSKNASELFSGAQIDVVEFPEGLGAKEFKESLFQGTIQKQLTDVLSYLKSQVVKSKIIKYSDRAESDTVFNYPYEALEEALSNAVYHKNYELREPIEVRVLPTAIEIISYNGVDPSLKQSDFDTGTIRNRRYRNRRIGEFLKELNLTEGRGTGIPTMKRVLSSNGSPKPIFDTNEPERSCFVTELTIHPDFIEDNKQGGQVSGQAGSQVDDSIRAEFRNDFGMISERIRNDFGKEVAQTFKIICKNPDLTAKEISQLINKSPRTVENHTAKLKEAGIIERKGAKLGGHWNIIDKKS